ncbi:MAG TPA: hypothetical protein VHF69_13530 [Candidatus Synoicihabitans sp.]|nr:hypothetical protein [Candidatus Synoicihabitans sp.]
MVPRVHSLLLTLLLPLAAITLGAQPVLHGKIEGTRYHSPTGEFSITIPVLPELGGSIEDTPNVVTFQDEFNLHASIACFEMDATHRWENETRGRREYLIWFFSNFVQSDFRERFPGSQLESAKFFGSFLSGSLLVYNLLPGGSMFEHRISLIGDEAPPVAKRGNLLFVHDGHIYVISTELAEKVVERRTFNKSVEDENEILRKRLFDLVARITFAHEPATPPNS